VLGFALGLLLCHHGPDYRNGQTASNADVAELSLGVVSFDLTLKLQSGGVWIQ